MKSNRSKTPSKKERGVDFKKIRRKIGRKLPPPKNATNTEIKSKAIVIPEQSVASEKVGLAVNKKGLTLKELLQQTSHHNAKVRRDALMGIKDLFIKHPAELELHKYTVIEKLRERIGDDDKVVRKSLYDLFKLVILPGCKEDNQVLLVSLLMGYIFLAMANFAVDIRLMAFEFLDLVLEFHPPSFSSHVEKIFQNYELILKMKKHYSQDVGKLKDVVAGLVHCLSLLPWNKEETDLNNEKYTERRVLHAFEDDMLVGPTGFCHIIKNLKDLLPVLLNSFLDFIPLVRTMASLDGKSFCCMQSILCSIDLIVRSFVYGTDEEESEPLKFERGPHMVKQDVTISSELLKKLFHLFPLSPVHHLSEKDNDRFFELNMVITKIFLQLNEWICLFPGSLEKFLEFMEKALLGKESSAAQSGKAVWGKHLVQLLPFIPKFVSRGASYWTSRLLQAFTQTFRESKPGSLLKLACISAIEDMLTPIQSKLPLDTSNPENFELQASLIAWIRELPLLLIQLGDKHPACSLAVLRLQLHIGQRALFVDEYDNLNNTLQEFFCTCQDGHISYGPFLRLPRESQELSLSCLYYLSHLDGPLLTSITRCCICPDLDPQMLYRIITILDLAYGAGNIKIPDLLSVYITFVYRFKVSPVSAGSQSGSTRGTFKEMTRVICSYMEQMGNNSIVLRMIEKLIIEKIVEKLPLDNTCSFLRILVTLDSKLTILSEQSFLNLGHYVSEYLMDAVQKLIIYFTVPQCNPEADYERPLSVQNCSLRYYLLPCFLLFDRCHKLMELVLRALGSAITEINLSLISDNRAEHTRNCLIRVNAAASVLLLMHKEVILRQIMSLFREDIDKIIQEVLSLQSSENISMGIEERHKIHCAYDRLKILTSTLS